MRTLTLTAMILLAPCLWASSNTIPDNLMHHLRMQPLDGLQAYPSLELDTLPSRNSRKYVPGWQHPLQNINHVSAIIADDSGYYIAGTTLHSDDIEVHFDRGAIDDLLSSPSSHGSTEMDLFSTSTPRKIAVSLYHLAADGSLLWVNRFDNDLVTSGPMVRLPDGRILLAMTPLLIDEENSFSSFLFVISAGGQILQRREFNNEILNSLMLTSAGEVLAGIVRRETVEGRSAKTLRQYAVFLDTEGRKQREVALAKHPGIKLVYKTLSLIKEYDDVFVLSGGDTVFTISKAGERLSQTQLSPSLESYAAYYINAFYRDADKNLILLGSYGREKSLIAEMQLNYLQSVTMPTTPGLELTPAYQRMVDNPLLRGVYNDLLRDMRRRISEQGTPFNAVLTNKGELINLIDPEQESQQHGFTGSNAPDSLILIERIKNNEQQQYYLLDHDFNLLLRDKQTEPFCEDRCLLTDSSLVYLQWDKDLPGYQLHQGEFATTSELSGQPGPDDQAGGKSE